MQSINELTISYEVSSGTELKLIPLTVTEERRKRIKPVRMRAGVPDYDTPIYDNPAKSVLN